MWSFTKGVKSAREDNKEGLPGTAAFPHDRLVHHLFSKLGLDVVTEERLQS